MVWVGLPLSIVLCALLCGLGGCDSLGSPARAPAVPTERASPEVTDAGQVVLRVADGHLSGLEGRRVDLPAGGTTFLVHHDGGGAGDEDYEGEPPMTALWLRGRGESRHLLPSLGSPALRIDTMEDWAVQLPAGTYTLSVSLGTTPAGSVSPGAVLVVR